jgi:hypothetical protein
MSFDVNGIEHVQPLHDLGYHITYSDDDFTFVENFRTDGSMRCNFRGEPVRYSTMLAGYFKVDVNTAPDGEEVAAELNGGMHSGDVPPDVPNNLYADNMDIGIINMTGTSSRVRFEGTHPNYTSGQSPTYEELPLGLDIRGIWLGYIGLKLNIDTDGDGVPDKVGLIGMVDIDGLDGSNVPQNNWVVTYRRFFTEAEIQSISASTPIKNVFTNYAEEDGNPEFAEQTIRIDDQIHADWTNANVSLRPYKYVTCKTATVTKIRDVCEIV